VNQDLNAGGYLRAAGDAALLVNVAPELRHAATRALSASRPADLGVVDIVAGETSVLVTFDPVGTDVARVDRWIAGCRASPARSEVADNDFADNDFADNEFADNDTVTIEVRYDGADLADVAALTGLTPDDVISRHVAGRYVVAFMGFAPGFGYLEGLDPALKVPRLATPRARVDAGAVAIADGRSCVYPRAMPGGWRVLGHTDAVLFDPAADPPTLLCAGSRVRFVES
jgi:KipI family sensor histidine kinase inhibitor